METPKVQYAEVVESVRSTVPLPPPKGDGYGSRLPTQFTVRLKGEQKFRKVYAICYSNVASFYVKVDGETLFVRDSDLG